jgi:hypothetical protein
MYGGSWRQTCSQDTEEIEYLKYEIREYNYFYSSASIYSCIANECAS